MQLVRDPNKLPFTTTITRQDWSLHRKGPIDQQRHQERVREAISGELPGILSDESIIGTNGQDVIKIPVRSLDLPHFRFNRKNNKNQAGQGEGKSQVGDVLGQKGQPGFGPGQGEGAGETPGIDYFEAEYTLDQLSEMLFNNLGLPNLMPKGTPELTERETVFDDIRRTGPMSNLDKKRMIRNALKRNAIVHGRASLKPGIQNEDLRYRTWTDTEKPRTEAVVVAMRDVSGSMGDFEKSVSRAFYWWTLRFLRTQYNDVKTVFITHHTQAKEVDEQTFFNLGESGGTEVAPAYRLATDILKNRYRSYNAYPMHLSDGETNGEQDNQNSVQAMKGLLEFSNQAAYAEIRKNGITGAAHLSHSLRTIGDPHLAIATITNRVDIFKALQQFFTPTTASSD